MPWATPAAAVRSAAPKRPGSVLRSVVDATWMDSIRFMGGLRGGAEQRACPEVPAKAATDPGGCAAAGRTVRPRRGRDGGLRAAPMPLASARAWNRRRSERDPTDARPSGRGARWTLDRGRFRRG